MNVIVGSGPAGVTVAHALLARGEPVTVLDGGRTLDPERAALARSLAALEPARWPDDARRRLAFAQIPTDGIPKLELGSDHPYYRDASVVQHGTRALLSLARGGLSTVWGAAVLPSRADDRRAWPLDPGALDPHYAAVTQLLGVTGEEDELSAVLPTFGPLRPPLPLSRQAVAMLERARRHAPALRRAGFVVGRSRLAVRTEDDPARGLKGCRLTADCMSGCVYGAIWRATDVLDALRGRPGFHERPGFVVRKVEVTPLGPRVEGHDGDGGEAVFLPATRVFLAAGPIATARIVLDSLGFYDRPIPLQFQPYFALPLLTRDAADPREPRHALAQLFIELEDPSLSRSLVHLQVYTHGPRLEAHLHEALGPLGPLGPLGRIARGAEAGFAPRLAAIQGYLHSADVPPITLTATAPREGAPAGLTLRAPDPRPVDRLVDRVLARLLRVAPALGVLPLPPQRGMPGDGNHLGGSFPMCSSPSQLETDTLGRLPSLPGVHVVDASVLPDLPATTLTLTVMANAHRIAMRAGRD